MAKRRTPQPTVPDSVEVDKAAWLLFAAWLPGKWLLRKQDPDYGVDYRVEVVAGGEPTGLHFQAQVKGRSIHKRRTKKLAEPLSTKHLRYYVRCQEPVFIFLIDPATKQGNWLFIQAYLREQVSPQALRERRTLTLRFDAERHLENRPLFEKDLREAWAYMRELYPGPPIAAILAEKQRLEQLDPRYSVQLVATADSQALRLKPVKPLTETPKLKFLNNAVSAEFQALCEKGQSFQVKATEVEAEGSPILTDILQQLGNAEITIQTAATFKGCLHLLLQPAAELSIIQVDGEWLLAPKQVAFKGQLPESPFKAEFTCDPSEGEKLGPPATKFRFNWCVWRGQPLLSLSYFGQISAFVRAKEYAMVCFIRGNPTYKARYLSPESKAKQEVAEALEWLSKCRRVAQRLGVNPLFQPTETLAGEKADDVRLLVKLLECGGHEQNNAGQPLVVSADTPAGGMRTLEEPLTITRAESKVLDFFGIPIPFGPMNHTWTDMHFVSTRILGANRVEMTFKGGPSSIWRIDYQPAAGAGGKA